VDGSVGIGRSPEHQGRISVRLRGFGTPHLHWSGLASLFESFVRGRNGSPLSKSPVFGPLLWPASLCQILGQITEIPDTGSSTLKVVTSNDLTLSPPQGSSLILLAVDPADHLYRSRFLESPPQHPYSNGLRKGLRHVLSVLRAEVWKNRDILSRA
jgi:hypothetical protein